MSDAIQFCLTGLGGYGGELCDRLLKEQSARSPRARLIAVQERNLERFEQRVQSLTEHGIEVVRDYDELLTRDVQCIWLPLPIDLHREFTERALAAGKAVICEKPAAGSLEDVDAMIAARDRTGLFCAIGYQDVYQPAVWELKRRILTGEFGVMLSASVLVCWPRGERYYKRNEWAGKIKREGRWILDSPANNAMAHYIHLAQFLMGRTENESAIPAEVEAELYRVNPIENYDTCSLRMTFDGGAHLLVHLTHACRTSIEPQVVIRTQFAEIRYLIKQLRIEIITSSVTEIISLIPDRHGPILEAVWRSLRGRGPGPIGTLEMARAHTLAMCAASASSAIVDVPTDQIEVIDDNGSPLRTIPGFEQALTQATQRGRMLHECGIVRWSKPAGHVYTDGAWQFSGPAGNDH